MLLADRHHGLRDSVRGLLEAQFASVIMVANEASLLEGAGRLKPTMVVIDLSLAEGDVQGLLMRVAERAPDARLLMLTVHDESPATLAALVAGADGVVLKRDLATELPQAVDALRSGARYLSPSLSR